MSDLPRYLPHVWRRTVFLACGWVLLVGPVTAEDPAPVDALKVENAPPGPNQPQPVFRLFGRGRAADREASPRREGSQDVIDARAPREIELEAFWNATQKALEAGDWKRGLEGLQKILDLPRDVMAPDGRGGWQSLRALAQRRLDQAPPAVRADYEHQYGGLAQQLWNDALRSGSLSLITEVATRFLHTRAGAEAANWLATRHLDRREWALAWRWFRDLDAAQAAFTKEPRWRLKAALAAQAVAPEALPDWLKGLPDQPLEFAGLSLTPHEVLRKLGNVSPDATWAGPVLAEWPYAGGDPTRSGRVTAGEPLLQPEWSVAWTTHPQIRQRIGELLGDLQDKRVAPLLASQPLAVGDKIAFRNLQGVHVLSAQTGELLWETTSGLSPERILLGQTGRSSRGAGPRGFVAHSEFDLRGQDAEFHPLADLLFRDGVYGSLSSDGRQLFVIEDLGVLTRSASMNLWGDQSDAEDAYGVAWNVNRLTAYDLETGRVRWTLGGKALKDLPGAEGADVFFLGTPLAVGDELYVVTSQGETIRLLALDASTGHPRWSQRLAYADTKIETDFARRWASASIAYSQGILVCPTTVGWLVAIDRVRRSLLWIYRYLPPQEIPPGAPQAQPQPPRPLNDQWATGTPYLTGQAVLFAPPDAAELHCVDLAEGRVRWKFSHALGESLYVGGVHAGHVLVVEKGGVVALSLATGQTAWRFRWDEGLYPSGRGVISGERFVLPLGGYELLSLDIATGTHVLRWRIPSQQPALGNLIKAHGRWLSLSLEGCTAYGEREPVLRQLAQTLERHPYDLEALFKAAEIDLLDRQYAAVEQRLQHLPPTLEEPWETRRRHLLWQLWSQRWQESRSVSPQGFAELRRLARTPEEQFLVALWEADHGLAQGQALQAFERMWDAALGLKFEMLTRPDAPQVRVRATAFLSGWFADLWSHADDATRQSIDAVVTQAVARARTAASPATPDRLAFRQRLAELCTFHPAGALLGWDMAEARAAEGDFAGAETILAQWSEYPEPSVAAASALRLAALWQQWGLEADIPVLARAHPGFRSGPEPPWDHLLAQLPADAANVAPPSAPPSALWRARQGPTLHAPPTQEIVPPAQWPSWQRFAIQVEPHDQRVTFQLRSTDRWYWLAPLRAQAQSEESNVIPARVVDHRLWVLSRNVLHNLSPFERKIVWTRPLTDLPSSQVWHPAQRALPTPLIKPTHAWESVEFWQQRSLEGQRFVEANRRYLCLVGRRELAVLDPLTGRDLWRKTGLAPNARVLGSPDIVFVYHPERTPALAEAYRAQDGRPLTIPALARRLKQTLCLVENDLILLERPTNLFGLGLIVGKTSLKRWQPLTQQDVWKLELPAHCHLGVLDANRLIVLQPPSGRSAESPRTLEWIELHDGSRHVLDSLTCGPSDSFIPVLDGHRLYLVINSSSGQGNYYGDSLPTIPVNGRILAWDLRTKARLWQRDVSAQHLILDRLQQSPALVFLSRSWKQQGNASYTQLSLLALHKDSGHLLYEQTSPSAFSGFHTVKVRSSEAAIELQAYNLRLRLGP